MSLQALIETFRDLVYVKGYGRFGFRGKKLKQFSVIKYLSKVHIL